MKGQIFKITIIVECTYTEDCIYKNRINNHLCNGCRYAWVIKQTPPEIVMKSIEEIAK